MNEISRRTKKNKRKVISQLAYLERNELVKGFKGKKKKFYELTSKGRDACAYYRVRQEAGYSGIEWAKDLFTRGYKVRFLQDLTGLPSHKRWLFAWNPETRDVDMALIFGTRSVSRESDSPAYVAQYVNRDEKADGPIRHNVLFDFIKNHVKNFENEDQLARVLKDYWDPKTHNSYLCALLPEKVSFGFPHEIGHFDLMAIVGFGYQESFPFIPKMTFAAGSLDIGKNFRVDMRYWINMIDQHRLLWLYLKRQGDPPASPEEREELQRYIDEAERQVYGRMVEAKVACKHGFFENCKKMGIKCQALENGNINISKCPILMEEIRQVRITFAQQK